MNRFTKSALCLSLLLAGGLQAAAWDLVSPQEGTTTKVTSLGTVKLVWDTDWCNDDPNGTLSLLNSEGEEISTAEVGFDDLDFNAYSATFNPTVTELGTYTVVVPANLAPDNDNPEYRLTFEIIEDTSTPAVPTAVYPEDGSDITQDMINYSEFTFISLTFGNDAWITPDESLISITDGNGDKIAYTLSGSYEEGDPQLSYTSPIIVFNFNEDGYMPSGTYTFSAKPGAFTSPRGINEEAISYTYTYTRTKPDPDPTPLEIESALMGLAKDLGYNYQTWKFEYEWIGENAVEVTPDMEVAEFVGVNDVPDGGTAFLLSFNHGEKAGYVSYELLDATADESLYQSICLKQDDGKWLLPWVSTLKLIKDKQYALEFHTYNNEVEMVEFGDGARLTFMGTSEPFPFSSAEFVTVVPTSGSTLNSLKDNKATVLFTEPVKATATYNEGFGFSESIECTSATFGAEYDNVWYVFIPDDVMKSRPEVEINVTAYGQDGNIVNGNMGWEETATNQFSYNMTLCQPRVAFTQGNTHVPAISTFNVFSLDGKPINGSWSAYPYVTDEKGEIVANLNLTYYNDPEMGETPYKPLNVDAEGNPGEIEIQFTPAITEKGRYTVVLPEYSFNVGTQFDGYTTVEQEMTYTVVDFYPVTYTVDNNTVFMNDVEAGASAEINIQAAEDWKLETLMLNDKDVTADVTGGRYVSPAAYGAIGFTATFSYDNVLAIPTDKHDIVTDLNLRGWSEDGAIYVGGLKEGQVVSVFTVGGSCMTTVTVGNDDAMKFSLPEGVYIVTVTDGETKAALKIMNE